MKLFGTVKDQTGIPVEAAVVTVDPGVSEDQTVVADAYGRFSVEAYVGNGAAIARVEKEGFYPKDVCLYLNNNETPITVVRRGAPAPREHWAVLINCKVCGAFGIGVDGPVETGHKQDCLITRQA